MTTANTAQMKMMNWGDDLRLPTFTDPAEFTPIVDEVEEFRSLSIPFQSKHLPSLKRNVWFALKRHEDRIRSGILCIWPARKCCVFVLGRRVAHLRLRVDPQLLASGVGKTVFAASLYPSARKMVIEDTLVWKGRNLEYESFSKRWVIGKQCVEQCIVPDAQAIGGMELEMGKWAPLATVQSDGSWDLVADDSRTRLFWKGTDAKHTAPPVPAPAPVPMNVAIQETNTPKPIVALAKREAGPDQWSLSSSDGVSLGRALIRTMSVSSSMNAVGDNTHAEVAWNADFNKWEILSVHSGPASAASFFTKA